MAEIKNAFVFGSDEFNRKAISRVRIWRGYDGLTKTARFPDGTVYRRDMNLWPKSNGYNPAIFTINGEIRLTTPRELNYLQRLNNIVKAENVIYRKDFVAYMDYELGILRDSDGKLIDVRPKADRGYFDEILNHGLTKDEFRLAEEKYIKEAAEYADRLADNDRNNTELFGYVGTKKIGYHGELEEENPWQNEWNRDSAIFCYRLYPENEDTRWALQELADNGTELVSDKALDILARNFSSNYLASNYVISLLSSHYDALGDFYKNQVDVKELQSIDVTTFAAKDALKGAYCREKLSEIEGYSLDDLCKLSTQEAVEKFNLELDRGLIDIFKGGNLDMAMYKASKKQCEFISKNYDKMYLPDDFKAKYSHKDVALDAVMNDDDARKMDYNDAKEAFAFNSLMIHLKPYVTDAALAKVTTAHEAYNQCLKYYDKVNINENPAVYEGGKVNRAQAKELKANGLDPKDFKTYEEAKAKLDTFAPTAEQVRDAKKFMQEEDIEKLNRGELDKVIRENKRAYAEFMNAEVVPEIRAVAEKAGLITGDKPYTNSDWAKDSLAVPPTRSQLAFVHQNALEDTIEWYAKNQAERGNNKFVDTKGEVVHSVALYKAVQDFTERKYAEKENGPMDKGQIAFFQKCGWEVKPEMTWKDAQKAMVGQLYLDRLIGAANHRFILDGEKHPNGIPGIDTDKLFKYDMTDKERDQVRKEVAAACDKQRIEDRLAAIEGVRITDQSVYGSARNFVYNYMHDNKGKLDGVEEAMATAYARGEITFPDERMVAEKGVESIAVGHVMATVLPSGIDYNNSVGKFSDMYEVAAQEANKERQAIEQENSGNNNQTKSNEGEER